tara:strand:- start:520 stop:915 length:396 start_codon:yes stop_codon:yes gene_type:complete
MRDSSKSNPGSSSSSTSSSRNSRNSSDSSRRNSGKELKEGDGDGAMDGETEETGDSAAVSLIAIACEDDRCVGASPVQSASESPSTYLSPRTRKKVPSSLKRQKTSHSFDLPDGPAPGKGALCLFDVACVF